MEQCLWHPIIASQALPPSGAPVGITLLEQDLVVWRDRSGQVQLWEDRCPHRGAKLSFGKVVEDRLECPYHGWQFSNTGQCMLVPAAPEFRAPASHCVKAFEAAEAYGLVWGRLAPGDATIPAFAQEQESGLRKVMCGPYEVATSAPRIVENFLDMAHFGFVHEGWLGDRAHTAMQSYEAAEHADHVLLTQCFAWQPKSSVHATTGANVEYTYLVNAPYTAILTKIPEAGTAAIANLHEAIALFVMPIAPERSRVWIRMAMNDFESEDQKISSFQDTIFGQDLPVLESQRPRLLPLAGTGLEVHGPADRGSAAYRRYLERLGVRFGVLRKASAA
jgi:phenylpropionate dioxygenase-like ring-hydroxylating dioxygenase large terminal subunit